jgi:hypothetical protein
LLGAWNISTGPPVYLKIWIDPKVVPSLLAAREACRRTHGKTRGTVQEYAWQEKQTTRTKQGAGSTTTRVRSLPPASRCFSCLPRAADMHMVVIPVHARRAVHPSRHIFQVHANQNKADRRWEHPGPEFRQTQGASRVGIGLVSGIHVQLLKGGSSTVDWERSPAIAAAK